MHKKRCRSGRSAACRLTGCCWGCCCCSCCSLPPPAASEPAYSLSAALISASGAMAGGCWGLLLVKLLAAPTVAGAPHWTLCCISRVLERWLARAGLIGRTRVGQNEVQAVRRRPLQGDGHFCHAHHDPRVAVPMPPDLHSRHGALSCWSCEGLEGWIWWESGQPVLAGHECLSVQRPHQIAFALEALASRDRGSPADVLHTPASEACL